MCEEDEGEAKNKKRLDANYVLSFFSYVVFSVGL